MSTTNIQFELTDLATRFCIWISFLAPYVKVDMVSSLPFAIIISSQVYQQMESLVINPVELY